MFGEKGRINEKNSVKTHPGEKVSLSKDPCEGIYSAGPIQELGWPKRSLKVACDPRELFERKLSTETPEAGKGETDH